MADLILDLPVKIILNEDGVDWFIKHGKTPKRINLADMTAEYGVELDRVSESLLVSMVSLDYVSKIEVARAEFSSKRKDILSLSRLIVDNILFKQFDMEVFGAFINSDLIKGWNRANPSKVIDKTTRFNRFFIESKMNENKAVIEAISNEIAYPIKNAISISTKLEDSEKAMRLSMIDHYIGNIRKPVWVFLATLRNRVGYSSIITSIRKILARYMDRSRITEYIGLIVVELATNAENVRIKEIAKSLYPEESDIEKLVFSKKIRKEVFDKLVRDNDYLYLTWKLGGKSTSIGTENRLQIILFNQEYDYSEIKKKIEDKSGVDLRAKSLLDFYNELPEQRKDIELGLYYLSYLQEECKKHGIRFESFVGQSIRSDLTVITLDLQF